MPGIIAIQPRPLGPKRGVKLGLGAMQTDQMSGHMPEISFVHGYTCLARARPGQV